MAGRDGGDDGAGGRLPADSHGHRQPHTLRFQADIMNGVDPSPQDVSLENGFFTKHR